MPYERRGQSTIYETAKLGQRQRGALIENSAEAISLSLHFGVLNCSTILYKLDCYFLLLRIREIELDCWNAFFKNLAALLVIIVDWDTCMFIDLVDLSFLLDLCYIVLIFIELLLKDELTVLSNRVIRICRFN